MLFVRVLSIWVQRLLGPELANLWACAFGMAQWQFESVPAVLHL